MKKDNMKKNITLILLLITFTGYSQKHEHLTDTIVKTFVPIKTYKQKFTEHLTKKDSINFKFKDNDTLVLVDQFLPKGIYVPYEYKDSLFLNYYKKIAFNHKKGEFSYDTRMRYWKNGIKIFFSKDISKNIRKELMSFASEISKNIDSLNISRVNKLEKSNYVIYYKGSYEYESRMINNKNSDYHIRWAKNNSQIFKGAIRLNTEHFYNDNLKLIKLKELFLKSLGHFIFIDEFECENYFADCNSEKKKFSNLDFEILKHHYSYGICKGTDLATFEEQHEKAKEILKKYNRKMNFIHPN